MDTSDEPISWIMLAGSAASTAAQIQAQRAQGDAAQAIGKTRAAIDEQNAAAALKRGIAAGKMKLEEGKRLLASNRATAAARGIEGGSDVVETQNIANVLRDANLIFETGSGQSQFYRSSAGLERASGRYLKRESQADMWGTGFKGGREFMEIGIEEFGWFTDDKKV
jgi:hypothetical protein